MRINSGERVIAREQYQGIRVRGMCFFPNIRMMLAITSEVVVDEDAHGKVGDSSLHE